MTQSDGDVIGHYSVVNNRPSATTGGSHTTSKLFRSIVNDSLDDLLVELGSDSSAVDVSKQYNVLYWNNTQGDTGSASGSTCSVKAKSIVALASLQAAQTGRFQVLKHLLGCRGADNRAVLQEAAQMAQTAQGEFVSETLALLQSVNPQDPVSGSLGSTTPPLVSKTSGMLTAASLAQSTSLPQPPASFFAANASQGAFSADASSEQSRDNNASHPAASFSLGDLQHHLSLSAHQEVTDVDAYNTADSNLPYSTAELTQAEYSTDDFRMFAFKVLRCSKRCAHDWRACPFAHPTENARRRDPREYRYCAIACPDYRQGFCVRGDLCSYSHGVFEAWLHPSRYRTQLCKDGANCHRPICFFAHSLSELRTPTHTWTPGSEETTPQAAAPVTAEAPVVKAPEPTTVNTSGDGGYAAALKQSDSGSHNVGHMSGGHVSGGHLSGRKSMDPGIAAAAAAGAVQPVAPGLAAAAMFGFTAPRMSNAFARRHGLNPKDNAMLNLQKIALQAQQPPTVTSPGSIASGLMGQDIMLGNNFTSNRMSNDGSADLFGGGGAAAYAKQGRGGGRGGGGGGMAHYSNASSMMGYGAGAAASPLMIPSFQYPGMNPALMGMAGADPATLASLNLNHHLASLSLHPGASFAAGQAAAMGMAGFGGMPLGGVGPMSPMSMGMGLGFPQQDATLASGP